MCSLDQVVTSNDDDDDGPEFCLSLDGKAPVVVFSRARKEDTTISLSRSYSSKTLFSERSKRREQQQREEEEETRKDDVSLLCRNLSHKKRV